MKHLETARILHGTPHECEGSWIINYTWVASRQASSLTMDSEKLKQATATVSWRAAVQGLAKNRTED